MTRSSDSRNLPGQDAHMSTTVSVSPGNLKGPTEHYVTVYLLKFKSFYELSGKPKTICFSKFIFFTDWLVSQEREHLQCFFCFFSFAVYIFCVH